MNRVALSQLCSRPNSKSLAAICAYSQAHPIPAGLVHIQNIERVEIIGGSTNMAFRPLALIESENARNKVTHCEMPQSMTSGDPRT